MKPKYLLLVFAFFYWHNSRAQLIGYKPNYVPATLWLASGDSLNGLIDFQQWNLTPKEISFKKNFSDLPVKYVPALVSGFKIKNGERWVTYSGYLDQRILLDDQLTDRPYPDSTYATIFIRMLYSGKKNLYYVRDDESRDHFFFCTQNGPITEFHVNRYIKYVVQNFQDPTSPSKYIVENRQYKEQLMSLFGDCRKMDARLKYSNILYDESDFLNVFQEYEECNESTASYQGKKDTWQFIPVLNAGGNFAWLKVSYSDRSTSIDTSYNNSNFSFGIGLDCILPRNLGHWSIYNELFVRANNFGTLPIPNQGFNLNYAYLKLANLVRYYSFFPSGKFYPEIGMSNGINVLQNIPKDENGLTQTSGDYEQGLVLGAGAIWHNINLEARFEIANVYSTTATFTSSSHTLYLVAGYYFR